MSETSTNSKELVSAAFVSLISALDHFADDIKLECAEATMEGWLERSGALLEKSKILQTFHREVEVLSTRWSKGLWREPKTTLSKNLLALKVGSRGVDKSLDNKKPLKASSPKPSDWLHQVPELSTLPHTASWKAICDHLGIEVGGDSARRSLKAWAKENKKHWPDIPEPS